MPTRGRPWNRARAAFKAECRTASTQCWLCHGQLGPIDYDSPYDPRKKNNLAFTVDHVRPTSLGGDPMARSNWRAAHSFATQAEATPHAACTRLAGSGSRTTHGHINDREAPGELAVNRFSPVYLRGVHLYFRESETAEPTATRRLVVAGNG